MNDTLLVSYLARSMHGEPSGFRVWVDGRVELNLGPEDWKPLTQLDPSQLRQLEAFVRESGILEMPDQVPAPEGMLDGTTCEWLAELDQQRAHIIIYGWSDENPAAVPSRNLVMQMYSLISEAQLRSQAEEE